MIELNNFVLIAGGGRNVGKTTLGCYLVGQLKRSWNEVIAIKISSHPHPKVDGIEKVAFGDGWFIGEEKESDSGKDSARYLNVGANKVYYVQANNEQLRHVAEWFKIMIPTDVPVVCESQMLGHYIQPGLACFVKSENMEKRCYWLFQYHEINHMEVLYTPLEYIVNWTNGRWVFK